MPRKTKRILKGKPSEEYKSADTRNREGFPAWKKPDKELIYQFLYANTLEPTFYATQMELVQAGIDLLGRFDDPKYLAETIVKARNEGFMRTAPLMALVYLSKRDLSLFKKIFGDVVQTGQDMAQFLDFCRKIRGLGRGVKSTVQNWLKEKTSEFYAIKYGNELVDAVRLSRPAEKEFDEAKQIILNYLMKNPKVSDEQLPTQISAFKRLKRTTEEEEILRLIEEGRLDYSVVVGTIKPTPKIWMKLAEQMGTFALLRHLATFERNDVLKSLTNLIVKRLTVENLEKAKILPFRLYEAYLNINNPFTKQHLADLLDQYVMKYDFSYFGRVVICPDVSGSMILKIRKAAYTPATIAGMFAGILYKALRNAVLIPWDTEVQLNLVHPKNAPVLSHILSISNAKGGGTFMEAPIQYLISLKEIVDVVILITDSEEWGEGWLKAWRTYKEKINPKAKAFLIRIDPYNTNPFSPEIADKLDIYQIYGWNDSVIKYIEFILRRKEIVPYIT
nr:TROVE domain-containing protein [Candidatus Freyarchaeota archaeon]